MKKVLIVDDSSIMRRILKKILVKNGFKVVGEAKDGATGVRLFSELLPDVVTMDLVMDEMDGIEALSRILDMNPDANVIIVSSMGQEPVVRDAILKGAKAFILKPFTEKQIVDAFAKIETF